MRRTLPKPRHRILVKTACTCHDPTVFGHLTCTRAETQPNNTPPRPPGPIVTINATTLCEALDQLNAATRNTAEGITYMLNYIARRYNDPPPHG